MIEPFNELKHKQYCKTHNVLYAGDIETVTDRMQKEAGLTQFKMMSRTGNTVYAYGSSDTYEGFKYETC